MDDISSVVSLDISDIEPTKSLPRSANSNEPTKSRPRPANINEPTKSIPRSPNINSSRPRVHKRKPPRVDNDTDSLIIDEIEDETESPPSSRRPVSQRPQPRKSQKSPVRPSRPKTLERSSGSVDSLTLSDSDDVAPCYRRKSSFAVSLDSESMCVSTEPDCYRNSIVGPRIRQVTFDDDAAAWKDREAAKSVERYFKKWKMKTIFQVLEMYRAHRRQEFIYFTQQVHLYNQEVKALQDRINVNIHLLGVREEAVGAHRLILNRSPSLIRKFPLDRNLDAYFDTSYLYDEQSRDEELDWEKPFRSKEIKPQTNKTQGNGDLELSATLQTLDVKYDSVMRNRFGYRDDDNLSNVSSGCGHYSEGSGVSMSASGSRRSTPASPRPILKKYGYVN